MLVYDITNTKSFESISKWLRNIDEVSRSSLELALKVSCPQDRFLPQKHSVGLLVYSITFRCSSIGLP